MKTARTPRNIIDEYLQKAEQIKHDNRLNFRYQYWIKTPRGMMENTALNHEFGDTREGFEKWKKANPDMIAEPSNINLREVRERTKDRHLVGYVTEERLSDYVWHQEILDLLNVCFDRLCKEINVVDVDNFKTYIFGEESGYEDYADEFLHKLRAMEDVYDNYTNDPELKKLIDKIKG